MEKEIKVPPLSLIFQRWELGKREEELLLCFFPPLFERCIMS